MNVQHTGIDAKALEQARGFCSLHRIQRLRIDHEAIWRRRLFAPQLAVDEVADAAGEDADARQWRQKVEHIWKATLALTGDIQHRDEHADQAAVERHSAF